MTGQDFLTHLAALVEAPFQQRRALVEEQAHNLIGQEFLLPLGALLVCHHRHAVSVRTLRDQDRALLEGQAPTMNSRAALRV